MIAPLTLANVSVIAVVVTLHKGFVADHPDAFVERLSPRIFGPADRTIADMSGSGSLALVISPEREAARITLRPLLQRLKAAQGVGR